MPAFLQPKRRFVNPEAEALTHLLHECQRPSTFAIGLGVVILLVAAVTGRRNRIEYIDVWVDDDEFEDDTEMELPDLVSAEDDDSYDEEDIELVDFD